MSAALIHGLIRKEARSLLQFVGEAFPWAGRAGEKDRASFLAIAKHEKNLLDDLSRWCQRNKLGAPALGSYPHEFMDSNFLAIDFLLPKIVDEQTRRLAELQWARLSIPEAFRSSYQRYVEVKAKHLERLKKILSHEPDEPPPAGDPGHGHDHGHGDSAHGAPPAHH